MLTWRRRYYLTIRDSRGNHRTYWEAEADGCTYHLHSIPFRGWQAERNEGNQCTLPGIVRTKAEAVAWCENDYAQRQMQIVGIA